MPFELCLVIMGQRTGHLLLRPAYRHVQRTLATRPFCSSGPSTSSAGGEKHGDSIPRPDLKRRPSGSSAFDLIGRRIRNILEGGHRLRPGGGDAGGGGRFEPDPESVPYLVVMGVLGTMLTGTLLWRAYQNYTMWGEEISWQDFVRNYYSTYSVARLQIIDGQFVRVVLHNTSTDTQQPWFRVGSIDTFERNLAELQLNIQDERLLIPVQYEQKRNDTYVNGIFTLLAFTFFFYLMRRVGRSPGGVAGAARGRQAMGSPFDQSSGMFRVLEKGQIKTRFQEVAGCEEAKIEIMEFVNFLKHPKQYTKVGAKVPRGALLTGPPGTGKTLLAKATAGEANVPFINISGSEFVEQYVGVGAQRVRGMFKTARDHAPCILFIDEIDSIGRTRGDAMTSHQERENTLNQLLVEMDGFNTDNTDSAVIVMAATNRADVLDQALLRPGRFDRQIYVELPDIKGRAAIFRVHLDPLQTGDLDKMALSRRLAAVTGTDGFSGADIANVCNEAAIIAAREMAPHISETHFNAAVDRVIAGLERKSFVLQAEEKKLIAYHEAGHAVAAWFLEHASPVMKVSIIPHAKGIGYTQRGPEQDRYLRTRAQLLDLMCVALAGRAAERIFLGRVTTSGEDDLKKVTRMAYEQILHYGMSESLGPISYDLGPSAGQGFTEKPYSEKTARAVDLEVRKMATDALNRTKALLEKHGEKVKELAEHLLVKEVVSREELMKVLGERPFTEKHTYEEFVEGTGSVDEIVELPEGLAGWDKEMPTKPT